MTRDHVKSLIAKTVSSAVIANRLSHILDACKTVEEFSRLTGSDALGKYRTTKLGMKSKHDLGPKTYRLLSRVQESIICDMQSEKNTETLLKAVKAETWFSRDEITLAAAFMDSFKIARIELGQLKKLLETVVRESEQTPPASEEKGGAA